MQHTPSSFFRAAACSTLIALLAACAADTAPANDPLVGTAQGISAHETGKPGGVTGQITTIEATVAAIDYKQRTVTLQDALGNRNTLTVGPEAINFEQVKKGDLVKIAMVEELLVYVRDKGQTTNNDSADGFLGRAPAGEKPKIVAAATAEKVAVVKAVDLKAHTAVLQFENGQQKTVAVRKDVKLDKKQVGREVVFRLSKATALSVEPVAK